MTTQHATQTARPAADSSADAALWLTDEILHRLRPPTLDASICGKMAISGKMAEVELDGDPTLYSFAPAEP